MTRRNSLGKDAAYLTLSKMVTLVIAMVASMLLSRFRTYEEYGTYSQLQLVISLFTALFMLGLPNSINYFLARAGSAWERSEFLGTYYTVSTLLSMVMGLALVVISPGIAAYFKNPSILAFAYFLLLYPWANATTSGVENVLVVYHRTKLLTVYRIVNSACLLGIVLLAEWLQLSFSQYMVLYVIISCVFAAYVYYVVHRISGGIRISIRRDLVKQIFAFSLPIGLAAVVGTLNIEVDKLLIGWLMDTKQMAIYTNASKELPVSLIASSITAVLLPQLARMVKKERHEAAVALWGHATVLSYICISLIATGVFTYAEDVMAFLYSAKYLPGLPIFRVYSLVLLLRTTYFGIILNAMGRTKETLYGSVLSLGLNVVLNPLFFHLFGMVGPAWGTLVSMLVMAIWQMYRTSRCTKVPMRRIFPWKQLGMITLVNLCFAMLFAWMKAALPLDLWMGSLAESVLLGIGWASAYVCLLRKMIAQAWNGMNGGREEDYELD